jgi:hypothetical protein
MKTMYQSLIAGIPTEKAPVKPVRSDSTVKTPKQKGLLTIVKRTEPRPSFVYDTYWRFAEKRQAIYHRRVRDEAGPWSDDPVLQTYKFTNAYRAADRVSQYLIRNVIYSGPHELESSVLRTLLFKIFNKIETWELLEHAFGEISVRTFDPSTFSAVLERAMASGASIYSAAYIMPSGPADIRRARKHEMHLELLRTLLLEGFPAKLARCASMRAAYELFRTVPGVGPFLAYQFVTDLNYSPHFSFTELEFVMPGPGARDGLRKCFEDFGGYSEAEVIQWVTERQATEFRKRGLSFNSLWGRDLQLVDCQNLFCEVDKYSRVVHPGAVGLTGRTRIKQKFSASVAQMPTPWFPPKWGINERISETTKLARHERTSEISFLHPA